MSLHRYLVWLDMFLTNIEKSHPGAKELLMKGGIAVARAVSDTWCSQCSRQDDGGNIHEVLQVRRY